MTTRYSSHAVARLAYLTLVPSNERGLVRQRGPWLEIGAEASDDLIVTVACRRMVRREEPYDLNEIAVRELVEKHGYAYIAPSGLGSGPGIVDTTPERLVDDTSKRYIEKARSGAVGH
jgi:hypothetical protein